MSISSASLSLVIPQEYVSYDSRINQVEATAIAYNKLKSQFAGNYLLNRDIPKLLDQYVKGNRALDYGSGTGISTNILVNQNYQVTGTDLVEDMLIQSKINHPNVDFYLCEPANTPFTPESFDLVFSSLVLFELSTKEEIVSYLNEAKRLLGPDGVFMALIGSENMYNCKGYNFFNNDFAENVSPTSGDLVKIQIDTPNGKIEFTDFYWTEEDYLDCFKTAGFEVLKTHYPLGQESDPFNWGEEKSKSPYFIFVAKPISRSNEKKHVEFV